MRAALWLVGLFVAAVTLALFAGENQGTVTVFWPPHRVDLSVNLVLLLLAALFALLYAALRGIVALVQLPREARRWRAQQRERTTQALMLDARVQLAAGRFVRARKAAENVLARVRQRSVQRPDEGSVPLAALRTIAHLTAAESAHALRDEATRSQHLEAALASANGESGVGELREAVLLRAVQWALNDRDPEAARSCLAELPAGAQRRTLTLRLRLKAARQSGRLDEAMETAQLLAKHGAFAPASAHSLLRALAAELIGQADDVWRLQRVWDGLDERERSTPELALRGAERLLELGGDAAQARDWLAPAWEQLLAEPEAWTTAQRVRLLLALERAMASTGMPSDQVWLARIEVAQQAAPRDPGLLYLVGMSCMQRGLWGRAQLLLEQAAPMLAEPQLQRQAWCALARLAEQGGDSSAALEAWRAAAQAGSCVPQA